VSQIGFSDRNFNPVDIWMKLQDITTFSTEILVTSKSDTVRLSALRAAESILSFGLKQNTVSLDPRLARSRQAKGGGTGSGGSGEIPLLHPFIDRNDLETKADDLFTKVALYALRGGPQNSPFSPMLMCVLGQSICKVCEPRDEYRVRGAQSARVIVLGKNTKVNEMTHPQRADLVSRALSSLYNSCHPSQYQLSRRER